MREESFDIVIVGSGGGGLTAALAAHAAGLKPVILEKQGVVGGSTGMSGGMLWIPDNPLMKADGIKDSYQDGLDYLQAVIGEPDEPSSLGRPVGRGHSVGRQATRRMAAADHPRPRRGRGPRRHHLGDTHTQQLHPHAR